MKNVLIFLFLALLAVIFVFFQMQDNVKKKENKSIQTKKVAKNEAPKIVEEKEEIKNAPQSGPTPNATPSNVPTPSPSTKSANDFIGELEINERWDVGQIPNLTFEDAKQKFINKNSNKKFHFAIGGKNPFNLISDDSLDSYSGMDFVKATKKIFDDYPELNVDLPNDSTLIMEKAVFQEKFIIVSLVAEKASISLNGKKILTFSRLKGKQVDKLTQYRSSFSKNVFTKDCSDIKENHVKDLIFQTTKIENINYKKIKKEWVRNSTKEDLAVWSVEYIVSRPTGGEMTLFAEISTCEPIFIRLPSPEKRFINPQGEIRMFDPKVDKVKFPSIFPTAAPAVKEKPVLKVIQK